MSTIPLNTVNVSRIFALTRFVPDTRNTDTEAHEGVRDHWVTSAQRESVASRTLAGMLLAAVLAALLVAADQVVDTWSEGHLLMAWVALWTIAFAALAFLATPLSVLSSSLSRRMLVWAQAREAERNMQQMWNCAQGDHRLMADLRVAQSRCED